MRTSVYVIIFLCCLTCVMMSYFPNCARAESAQPVKMIFDTDIGNDIDDALALSVIHALRVRREVELLAVTVCKDNPWAAVYTDVINHFYGTPEIPIGLVRNGKTPDDNAYIRPVSERHVNGKHVYPRKLTDGSKAPDAVQVLRQTLAKQADQSVVIVSVGFMTNLARLLDTPSDEVSPLSGKDLVSRTVRLYVQMAGAFNAGAKPEFNVYIDAEASKKVYDEWPSPIIASGYEIGEAIRYPAFSIEHDFRYVENHPVAEAYRLYDKMPYDRQAWDLTAVLYAVRPEHGYFGISNPGKISLGEKSLTDFAEDSKGTHRFLTVTPDQIIRAREALVDLASTPPCRGGE